MNKKNYLESLKDIQEMSSRLKRFNINNTLNESVMFNEEFDEDIPENEEMPEDDFDMEQDGNQMYNQQQQQGPMKPQEKQNPEEEGMKELDEMGAIDKIREIALEGMRKLARQPEHPQYQALRKVLQLVDKSIDDEIKNQQQQQ